MYSKVIFKQKLWFNNGQWHPTPVLLPGKSHGWRSLVGCSPWGCEESDMTSFSFFTFTFTFHFHELEKEMATHSSVLVWRIPRTGEPGGLPSMGSHRVGHNWSDLAAAAASYCLYKFKRYRHHPMYIFKNILKLNWQDMQSVHSNKHLWVEKGIKVEIERWTDDGNDNEISSEVLLHHLCALKSKDFTLKPKSKPKLKIKPKNCGS